MFLQHLAIVSSTMICFDKSGSCFTISNEISLPEGFLASAATHYGNFIRFCECSELYRQILSWIRIWIMNERKNHFEQLCSRVLCKTKDLQQSSIVRCWIKFVKLEYHGVPEWIEVLSKGLMDWKNSTCRSLTRPNVNCLRPFSSFTSFSRRTFMSVPGDETSDSCRSIKSECTSKHAAFPWTNDPKGNWWNQIFGEDDGEQFL